MDSLFEFSKAVAGEHQNSEYLVDQLQSFGKNKGLVSYLLLFVGYGFYVYLYVFKIRKS
jgi:hypothetical protein